MMQAESLHSEQVLTLYQNKFITMLHDQAHHMAVIRWLPETVSMSLAEYKKCMTNLVQQYVENPVIDKCLILSQDFNFPVDPDTQVWVNEIFQDVVIQKSAMVMPIDIIASLGMKQTLEELDTETSIQYFGSEEKAREWLLAKVH